MAAYTVSNPLPTVFGDRKALICRITGDNTNYTTGGDVVQPSWFGMKYVDYIIFQGMDTTGTNLPIFLRTANTAPKILQFILSSAAEMSGANTSAFDVIVVGQ